MIGRRGATARNDMTGAPFRHKIAAMTSRISHTQVGDFRLPDGRGWITLTDPEGNEFCVLPPDQATSNPIS